LKCKSCKKLKVCRNGWSSHSVLEFGPSLTLWAVLLNFKNIISIFALKFDGLLQKEEKHKQLNDQAKQQKQQQKNILC